MILHIGLAAALGVASARAEVSVKGGAVRLGETRVVVLDHPTKDFDGSATVRFDPVVSVSDVVIRDGDLHCVVTGSSGGYGAIEVGTADGVERVDPGIVCVRDAAELGSILEQLLASRIRALGPPAAGPLSGAAELLVQLRARAPELERSAAAALVGAMERQILRAGVLSGTRLTLLAELTRLLFAFYYRRGPDGGCEIEEPFDESTTFALDFSHDVSEEDRTEIKAAVEEMAKSLDSTKLFELGAAVPEGKGKSEPGGGGIVYHVSTPGMVLALGVGPAIYGLSNASSNEIDIDIPPIAGVDIPRFTIPEALVRTTRADTDSNDPIDTSIGFDSDSPRSDATYRLLVRNTSTKDEFRVLWGVVIYVESFSTVSSREPFQLLDSWGVIRRVLDAVGAKISSNLMARNSSDIRTTLNRSSASLSQTAQARLDIREGEVFADERVILPLARMRQVMQDHGDEILPAQTEWKQLVDARVESALEATAFSRDWALGLVETGSMVWIFPWAICFGETTEVDGGIGYDAHAAVGFHVWHLGLRTDSGGDFTRESSRLLKVFYLDLQRQVFFYTLDVGPEPEEGSEDPDPEDDSSLRHLIDQWKEAGDAEVVRGLMAIGREVRKAKREDGLGPGERLPTGLENTKIVEGIHGIHDRTMTRFHEEYQEDLKKKTLTGEGP